LPVEAPERDLAPFNGFYDLRSPTDNDESKTKGERVERLFD
jgi:hypothetical protein